MSEEKSKHVFSAHSKLNALRSARRRLMFSLVVFSVALLIPIALLLSHVYRRLEAEQLLQYKSFAEDLSKRAAKRLLNLMEQEELRPFEEYNYFISGGQPGKGRQNFSYSPLTNLPDSSSLPGLIGYFQINPDGTVHSPLLSKSAAAAQDHLDRREVGKRIISVISAEDLLEGTAGFQMATRAVYDVNQAEGSRYLLRSKFIKNEKIVFFRVIWQDWDRYIQGLIVEQSAFFKGILRDVLHSGKLHPELSIKILHNKGILEVFNLAGEQLTEESSEHPQQDVNILLSQARLPTVLSGVDLLFTLRKISKGAGMQLVLELSGILLVILIGGMIIIYRLGIGQLELAQQRSDFVSAVTHELKSPLTSIRMYGEMLRSGWVTEEEKTKKYYDFIYYESERLSRLIGNILHLVRINKVSEATELKEYKLGEVIDNIESTVASQVEYAGFSMEIVSEESDAEQIVVMLDLDALVRIFVNLVDNALKFSKDSSEKKIVLGLKIIKSNQAETLCFFVRDYGPGVAAEQQKKIFELFYRGEDELTRATPGTGIGLALVKELSEKMGAAVMLENHEKGAEFQILFNSSLAE